MSAAELAERRRYIKSLVQSFPDRFAQVQRVYLEEPSYCIGDRRSVEFSIKSSIAKYFGVPYRSVIFTGSAHLGFSPVKGTLFSASSSDLDVAVVSTALYERYFQMVLSQTKAFTDLRGFTQRGGLAASRDLQDKISRRGMMPLWRLPLSSEVVGDEAFLAALSQKNTAWFAGISVVIYINEYAFCWKQASTLDVLRG